VVVIPIDNVSPAIILDNILRLIITEGIVRLNCLPYIYSLPISMPRKSFFDDIRTHHISAECKRRAQLPFESGCLGVSKEIVWRR